MFDLQRNLTQSRAQRRRESLSAYLDGALSARQRGQLEEQLAVDTELRRELQQIRAVKESLSRLPRARAPRNFTLDPALYGKPVRQPAIELYPVLRAATVVTAIMLVAVVSLQFFGPGAFGRDLAYSPAQEEMVALEAMAVEAPAMEAPVEVTRLVAETEVAAEEAAEEMFAAEAMLPMVASPSPEEQAAETAADESVAGEAAAFAPSASPSPQPTVSALTATAEMEQAQARSLEAVPAGEESPPLPIELTAAALAPTPLATPAAGQVAGEGADLEVPIVIPEAEDTAATGERVEAAPGLTILQLTMIALAVLLLLLLAATLVLRARQQR
jgi:anti-sigma factor RsiW